MMALFESVLVLAVRRTIGVVLLLLLLLLLLSLRLSLSSQLAPSCRCPSNVEHLWFSERTSWLRISESLEPLDNVCGDAHDRLTRQRDRARARYGARARASERERVCERARESERERERARETERQDSERENQSRKLKEKCALPSLLLRHTREHECTHAPVLSVCRIQEKSACTPAITNACTLACMYRERGGIRTLRRETRVLACCGSWCWRSRPTAGFPLSGCQWQACYQRPSGEM